MGIICASGVAFFGFSVLLATVACFVQLAAGRISPDHQAQLSQVGNDDAYTVLLDDGRKAELSSLVLHSCTDSDAKYPHCQWTDADGVPIAPLNHLLEWNGPGPALPLGQAAWRTGFPSAVDVSAGIAHAARTDKPTQPTLEDLPAVHGAYGRCGPKELDGNMGHLPKMPRPLDMPIFLLIRPNQPEQTRRTVTTIREAGFKGSINCFIITLWNDTDSEYLRRMGALDHEAVERIKHSSRDRRGSSAATR
jgi:hypothetical protein